MGNPASNSAHSHDEELLEYFEERLPEGRAQLVERHIAVCDACTVRAREVRAFHELWEGWTAVAHGRALQHDRIRRALRDSEAADGAWKERLRRWRTRWRGLSEVALQFGTRVSAGASEVVARGVKALGRPGSAWELRPVLEASYVRGDSTAPREVAEFATTAAGPSARIVVRAGDRGDVTIRIDGLPAQSEPPLTVLVAVGAGASEPARIVETLPSADRRYLVARFTDILPGEYLVLVEPIDTP